MSNIFSFTNAAHAVAAFFQDAVSKAKSLLSAAETVQGAESTVETITGIIAPQAVIAERAAFALLGIAIHVVASLDDAAAAKGANIALDADFVSSLKDLIPAAKSAAESAGLTLATPPAAPATVAAPAAPSAVTSTVSTVEKVATEVATWIHGKAAA